MDKRNRLRTSSIKTLLWSAVLALTVILTLSVDAVEAKELITAKLSTDTHDFTNETIDDLSLHFTLINNSAKNFSPDLSRSLLIIDGKPLPQSGLILGNGPRDANFESLPPGKEIHFVYGLGTYFSKPGIHTVLWRGVGFESPAINIQVRVETSAWKTIVSGPVARISAERAIYKRTAAAQKDSNINDHFFVHVKIENLSSVEIGFERVKRNSVFYPTQWAESMIARRQVISELRSIQNPISAEERARLLSTPKSLTKIGAGRSYDYFISFNRGTYTGITTAKCPYVILVLDGHMAFSNGEEIVTVSRSMNDSLGGEVPLITPVAVRELPGGANVLFD